MTGVAVVGTGFGCLTHVRCLRLAGFDVVALVGRDAARTKERAARFDVPHACGSLDEALALGGVDAVTIATPPHTHAALVRGAVGAGRHVVCEKPFARDAAEARSLLAAATAAGVVHFLGTEFRFSPGQALAARAVARDGAVGTPRLATFLLHVPMLTGAADEVPGWWADVEQGGGWLGAQASHVVDQIRTMLGEITGVSAALPRIVDRPGWTAEDAFSVRFRTDGAVDGFLQSTAADSGPFLIDNRVIGTDGTLTQLGDTVTLHPRGGGTRVLEVPDDLRVLAPDPPPSDLLVTAYDRLHSTGLDVGPYTRLFERFRDAITGDTGTTDPAPATFADGVAAMEVLDAIRASARHGGEWTTIGRP